MVAAPSPLYRVTPPAATSAGRRDLTTPPVLALGGYYGGIEEYVQTIRFATQKYTIHTCLNRHLGNVHLHLHVVNWAEGREMNTDDN